MLRLSTKARYSTRALVELAGRFDSEPLQLKEVARKQGISEKYLEQIFSILRAKGYLVSRKGSRGGYSLSRPPQEITLCDIVQAVEGPLEPVACVEHSKVCSRAGSCATRDVWTRLQETIRRELASVTLADLAQAQGKKDSAQADYQI